MPYTVMLLDALQEAGCETHLIVSDAAKLVLELENGMDIEPLAAKAAAVYDQRQVGAGPASGSWRHDGMVVCPCSMASLAAIANGLGSNLVHRAADVCMKEGRKLVLIPRETPLSTIHLKNLLAAKEAGAVILPPMPGFYHRPSSVEELLAQVVGRIMDQLGLEHGLGPRWGENG